MPDRRLLTGSPLSLDALNRPLSPAGARASSPFAPVCTEAPEPRPELALLTIEEVAVRLRISTKSVRRRIKSGLLRRVSLGGRAVRISPDELRRLTADTPVEEAS
jgi:excisionase family DNA binding protein